MKFRAKCTMRFFSASVSSMVLLATFSSCASVYVSKSYSDPKCYEWARAYLRSQGWQEVGGSQATTFHKGASVVPTFDYGGSDLEVQIHMRRRSQEGFDVEVGNWGMVGEIHLLRGRFERISDKLDEKISAECEADGG